MLTEVQAIISAVRGLNAEQRRELAEALALIDVPPASASNRRILIDSIRGKYKHIPTSSEDFSRRKAEDIELDSRL